MFAVIGIVAGFVSAMPLGPISAMAISARLHGRAREGWLMALTASACDSAYALLAIVAASGLNALFTRLGPWLQMGGGILLAGIAAGFFIKAARLSAASIDPGGGGSKTASPVLLTVLLYTGNPTIIVFWIALVQALSTAGRIPRGLLPSVAFAIFVGLGEGLWFNVLFRILDRSRDRISVALFRTILRVLAVLLSVIAARSLIRAAQAWIG
jgi:threonine/homoserine/homoserine lactone efflux protein